jgi:hypothetical protein
MDDSHLLQRPNFFNGRILTADDFAQEQEYLREKSKRHNRTLHGFGIVSGLKVNARAGQIRIAPGVALDCEGNELIVHCEQSVVVPAGKENGDRVSYLQLRFVENVAGHSTGSEAQTIAEGVEFSLTNENLNRGHRHVRARWLACGKCHALTIAKLKWSAGGWRVERGYRPPSVK